MSIAPYGMFCRMAPFLFRVVSAKCYNYRPILRKKVHICKKTFITVRGSIYACQKMTIKQERALVRTPLGEIISTGEIEQSLRLN